MKQIEVRDQVRLPLRRCFQLCVRGIRYRLFRSSVTVVIVALAVSFLMMMLSTSTVDRQVARDVEVRTADRRVREEWVDKLAIEMTGERLGERLARAELRPGTPPWQELRGWGGLSAEQLSRLKDVAERQQELERFLSQVAPGERSALVGARQGEEAIRYLADARHREDFERNVGNVRGAAFGHDGKWLAKLAKDFADTAELRKRILAGHAAAVRGLAGDLEGRSVLELLAGSVESGEEMLRGRGFVLPPEDRDVLRAEARLGLHARALEELLDNRMMHGIIAGRVRVDVAKLTRGHLYELAASVKGARWLKEKIQETRTNTLKEIAGYNGDMARLDELPKLPVPGVTAMAAKGLAEGAPGPKTESQPAWTPHHLGELVRYDAIRRAVATKLNAEQEKLNLRAVDVKSRHVLKVASNPEGARLIQTLAPSARQEAQEKIRELEGLLPEAPDLSPQQIAEVASRRLEATRLSEIQAALPEPEETGWMGFSQRTGWLILISFLVCVVGVANAMLMSVTERFREIATMKCLGAMDSFIMINFVLESSILGLAGGLIGVVLGLLLGVLRSVWGFGTLALANLPGILLLLSAGICLVAGVVLAALAAVYPAWVAARLAPMEAMRIE